MFREPVDLCGTRTELFRADLRRLLATYNYVISRRG